MNHVEMFFHLKSIPAFQMLRVSELGVVVEAATVHEYDPNQIIAPAGLPLSRLLIVVSGSVHTESVSELPGMIGVPSLLYDWPLEEELTTSPTEHTVCITIQKQHFFTLINECPAFLLRASEVIEPGSLYRQGQSS